MTPDETRLQAQARQQGVVVDLGMAALRGDSVGALIAAALAAVRETLGMDKAAVLRSDAAGSQYVLQAVDPPDPVGTEPVIVKEGDRSITGQTLSSGQPIVTSDAEADPRFDSIPSAGSLRVCSAITVIISGPVGPFGVLGVFHSERRDITDDEVRFVKAVANVLGAAVERRRTERALETSDARLRMAQEAGRMGVWEWDLKADQIIWSDALEHLYGMATGAFDGSMDAFKQRVHPDDVARVEDALRTALRSGGYEAEHRIVRADNDEVRWIVSRADLIRDEAGQPVRMVGINVDITERKVVEEERFSLLRAEQAARAAAERAHERLSFLSEATGLLSASLDYKETLQGVTRLAVPQYADLCIIDLLESGRLTTVALAHADPAVEPRLWDQRRRYPPATAPDDPIRETMRYGQPLMFSDMSAGVLAAMAVDGRHLEQLQQLHIGSGIIVPLMARGRVLGTLSLFRSAGQEPFDSADDQTLATELARRTALAIDNARLYAEASRTGERFRRMAETLQASLLPPNLPVIPGVDLDAKYRAAAAGTSVGGDFYDVFALGERGWGIVIGDVQGKGTEAATVTGIARHTIRTAAMRRNPAGSLHVLNEALLRGEEHGDRFCTVLYGELDVVDGAVRIELASGGHPPALLRRADGSIEPVGGSGSLMGVIENLSLNLAQAELAPGDALVFYTDGVTEARGPAGEYGEQRLIDVIAASGAASAQDITAAIVRSVTAFSQGQFRDDIALLVVRATGD
jgi:PAS domain S-box-containing protein